MFIDKKELARKLDKPIDQVVVGFTASSFDLMHAGHIVMLQESKQLCDYLIVGLLTDPTLDRPDTKNKPIQSIFERYVQVASCQYVDEVIPFESEKDLEDMIRTINPDIRIVGEEYKGKEHTGKGLCHIHYNKRRHSFSTSELRERVTNGK
jgi:glycerol-3-phosphate cytidylyltransferase